MPYFGVLVIRILLFRVPYFRKLPYGPNESGLGTLGSDVLLIHLMSKTRNSNLKPQLEGSEDLVSWL